MSHSSLLELQRGRSGAGRQHPGRGNSGIAGTQSWVGPCPTVQGKLHKHKSGQTCQCPRAAHSGGCSGHAASLGGSKATLGEWLGVGGRGRSNLTQESFTLDALGATSPLTRVGACILGLGPGGHPCSRPRGSRLASPCRTMGRARHCHSLGFSTGSLEAGRTMQEALGHGHFSSTAQPAAEVGARSSGQWPEASCASYPRITVCLTRSNPSATDWALGHAWSCAPSPPLPTSILANQSFLTLNLAAGLALSQDIWVFF